MLSDVKKAEMKALCCAIETNALRLKLEGSEVMLLGLEDKIFYHARKLNGLLRDVDFNK